MKRLLFPRWLFGDMPDWILTLLLILAVGLTIIGGLILGAVMELLS